MKKRLLKATFVVAAVTLTATGSLVAYDRYQQAAFAAANPLLEENLEALADPSSSNDSEIPHYGPALRVSHCTASLSDSIMWGYAKACLDSAGYRNFCNNEKVRLSTSYDDVPETYKRFMRFSNTKKYWTGERLEWELDGYFYDCQNVGHTSLSESNKPSEGIYLSKEEFTSAAF